MRVHQCENCGESLPKITLADLKTITCSGCGHAHDTSKLINPVAQRDISATAMPQRRTQTF